MKKLLLFTLFAAAISFNSFAQKGEMNGGVGLAYGSEVETIGINLNYQYFVTDQISLAPGFTFFFPKDDSGIKSNFWELNLNGHYFFVQDESLEFYGLAGLSFFHWKYDYDNFGVPGWNFDGDASGTELGLNLGAGANFILSGSITPFAELKYTIHDLDQLTITAGIRIGL